jgi:hypothetical protein
MLTTHPRDRAAMMKKNSAWTDVSTSSAPDEGHMTGSTAQLLRRWRTGNKDD